MPLKCGAGEDTFESSFDSKEINQSILKEINPEHSLEGLVLNEAETLIVWLSDVKSRLTEKDPDTGKD